MLSQTCEYALRAVMLIADRHGTPLTAEAIAECTQVPIGYLAKILSDLVKAGLIESQRGRNGGFTLSRDPAQLTLYDVVNLVDPITRITVCPRGDTAHTDLCSLHRRLDNALQALETVLKRITLAEVIRDQLHHGQICCCRAPHPNTGHSA